MAEASVHRRGHGSRPYRLWCGLSLASKQLITVGAVLPLLMISAVCLMMWQMRVVALEDVHQNLGKLGMAISEQTSRSMQAVDLELQSFQKDIATAAIDTPTRFATDLRDQSTFLKLRQADEALPQTNAFSIIDTAGKLVNFSRQWPVPDIDLSDRDYYTHLRDHDDPNSLFSVPLQNRADGGWTVYIVRRVNGPTGNFLGLLLGAIDLDYFRDFYKALTVNAGTTVTLLKSDGTALVSFPATTPIGQRVPATSPWFKFVSKRVSGAFEVQGLLTPGLRAVSVHPLLDYPLVVNVSVPEWTSLANWRNAALLAALGTSSAVLCILLLIRALTLQLQRLERSESSLERNSTALSTTLGNINQGIIMVDADGTVAVCNARALRMLDLPAGLATARLSFTSLVAMQQDKDEFAAYDEHTLSSWAKLPSAPTIYERQRPNGQILEVQSVPLATGGMVRTYTDITERRKSEEQVRYFAHHDDLTKLVNRVLFHQRLEHAMELADRSHRSVAVLCLDLDRFKMINDTRGHTIGDMLMVEVAIRLRGAVRDIDTVARMGGDEFAIIQPLIEQPASSAKLAERLVRAIKQPFNIEGIQCNIGVSIGIALYPDNAASSTDLLRDADTALYCAKADGRDMYRVFGAEMGVRQRQSSMLEQELRQALDLRQLELEYQPIVDMASRRITSFEALLRWHHPELGTVPPLEFIELAEESGMIIPIGLWAIEAACREAVTWPGDIQVAVNLSPMHFDQESLTNDLNAILQRTGFDPHRLIIEVTEGILLRETSTVLETMARLHGLGIRFSLDDFGTAHAGLSYLRRFPFDNIKIDKSFVQGMADQPEARAIVAAMVGIGTALSLGVIAEGVETERQMEELWQVNCQTTQGYLTGRPGSAAETRNLIQSNRATLVPDHA